MNKMSECRRAGWRAAIEKMSRKVPSGCWIYEGRGNKDLRRARGDGLILMRADGFDTGAHRVSYMAFHGDIPDGLFVMHSCDVQMCVNPEHLSLGTNADNLADMARKGRSRSGYVVDRLKPGVLEYLGESPQYADVLRAVWKFRIPKRTVYRFIRERDSK